ncbi:LOW QUALITY PROTEIN: MAX gene-associated protein [Gastrophryne carolinensis]
MPELTPETGSKPPSSTPAYFVIVHQPQGDDKKEERILVANRDVSAVAPVVYSGTHESKSIFLSADCTSGEITVTLDNNNMWNEFYRCSTEMVLTKQGRRMFPYCRYWVSGLSPHKKYILVMDITPLDTHRYKWNGKCWEPGGQSEPHVLGRVFIHPESPSTGEYWMNQPVSFYKLKLTNNVLDQEGHIILHSMHRYLPRLHVIPADKITEVIQLNGPGVHTFTFPQTEFFAVTAYQNIQITQLKIDCNPFAKGFRDGTVVGRPTKDGVPQKMSQANEVPSGKQLAESNQKESTEKMMEPFTQSEQSDADTENEFFSSEKGQNVLNFQVSDPEKILKQEQENHESSDTSAIPLISKIKEEPEFVQIKQEPEDNYDYDRVISDISLKVKQEDSNDEMTDEYSKSDEDYPILERHFAQFSTRLHSERKRSVKRPSAVAKVKLPKLEYRKMPKLSPESPFSQQTADNSNSFEPMLTDKVPQNFEPHDAPVLKKNKVFIGPLPYIKEEPVIKLEKRRPVKNKVYAEYYTPPTIKTNRGRKRKVPSLLPKAVTLGSEVTEAPVAKRRGRPPKNKGAKVGRPPKKSLTIEAPQLLPDFKPDLEDVDGCLFVAFSSKEALDVHTGRKSETVVPPLIAPAAPAATSALPPASPAQPVDIVLTEEQQKIADLEKQLLKQLRTMRHRQVIHPALQQVGLKLNIVDHTMAIDLWYLGVELPLPFFASDSRWKIFQVSSSAFSFVSRTGKTTDYTKIKGWRDKFSASPSVKIEGNNLESSLKNRSAFCSDELDEYLENEAKLMEDFKGTFQSEPVSHTINCQFPTKSSSYVRTLDSVLKKQASQLASSSSLNMLKPSFLPVKKRKYTRRRDVAEITKQKKGSHEISTATIANCPEKNTSYGGTPNSMLKKAASEISISNSVDIFNQPPLPVKKRKYTRRALTSKMKLKSLPAPSVITEKLVKPDSPQKPKTPDKLKPIVSVSVTDPVVSQPEEKLSVHAQSVADQFSVVSSVKDGVCPRANLSHLSNIPILQKTVGISNKAQIKLLELEENALWEGKQRTYITDERADIALSALLTAQASLKNRPVYKMINKKKASCRNEFCRLGCICSSLNDAKRSPDHCQQETCMFRCRCEKGNSGTGNDVPKSNFLSSAFEDKVGCSASTNGPQKLENATEYQEGSKNPLLMQKLESKLNGEDITTKKKDLADVDHLDYIKCPRKVFPIWDRSDIDNDPEPLCIPEQSAVGYKTPQRRGTSERSKSSAIKHDGSHTLGSVARPEDIDLEYFGHNISCARVRVYKPKAPKRTPKEEHNTCDSEAPMKEHTEQEKENAGDNGKEEVGKRHKKSRVTAKLLKIISDCNWEQDRRKILNIVSQHIDNKEPQFFQVGQFNIELTSENKDGNTSQYSAVSKMKISMAPDQKKIQPSAKVPPVLCNKTPGQIPTEACVETEKKSYGGKGLPFYTEVLPAGKLVARLKNSTLKQSELIQVNGKNYSQAKLLLGQMGALHPANKVVAYLTHNLQPNQLNMSTSSSVNITKMAISSPTKEYVTVPPIPPPALIRAPCPSVTSSPVSPRSSTVTSPTPRPVLTAETNKRLGPRLLLIPVPTSSTCLRPIQCVQTSPQRMVLQPIKSPNGINLFRHPNGQLIQLVPLHQVQAKNPQPSQHVVRNPGPAINNQLPLQNKHNAATTTFAATTVSSDNSALVPYIVSSSKISPKKSQVTIVPSNLSVVSQTTTKVEPVGTPPSPKVEVLPSATKSVDYTNIEHEASTSTDISLDSGVIPLLKSPSNTSVSNCQDDFCIQKVIAETDKPGGVTNANKAPSDALLTSEMTKEKVIQEKCKHSESVKTADLVQVPIMPKESLTSADQEGIGQPLESVDDTIMANQKPSEPEVANVSVDAISQGVSSKGAPSSSQKASQSSEGIERQSVIGNFASRSVQNTDCLALKIPNDNLSGYNDKSLLESKSRTMRSAGSDKFKDTECGQKVSSITKLTHPKSSTKIKELEQSSQTEDESEDDESVDIETVEELSEKKNIAQLEIFATPDASNKDWAAEKGCKTDSKVSVDEDLHLSRRNRHTHNVKERERRSELRDLFEELRNALGLQDLPKVSKSYILKKAIEEIEGLTGEADILIKQKTLLSQIQNQLIKEVSHISGKSKKVVLKKLECLYAKQKPLEVNRKEFVEELDVKTVNKSPPFTPLRMEGDHVEFSSSTTKKPLMLSNSSDEDSPDSKTLMPVTLEGSSTEVDSGLTKMTTASTFVSGQTEWLLPLSVQSSCLKNAEERPSSSSWEDFTMAAISSTSPLTSSNNGKDALNGLAFKNISEDVPDCRIEMELKKLSSSIGEAELEPNELLDVTGDAEDSDETLTSLLNEIELLNQQLNNDNVDMGTDFPSSDTASQISKTADGDSSPFFFDRFKELSESKENLLLSPLFLQLREGEIQENIKNTEEPSILVFEDAATKAKPCDFQISPSNMEPVQAVENAAVPSTSDEFWRPMPKLAPLGLKSPTVTGDQRVLLNKSMPSLASAAVRLSSPKPME